MMKYFIALCLPLGLCTASLEATSVRAEKSPLAVVNGKTITAGELTAKLWWQNATQALTELIDEKLLLEEARRLNIKADLKEVDLRYASLRDKAADAAQFEKNLAGVGWTSKDLKNLITRQITIRETVIAARKIVVTEEDTKKFFSANQSKLDAPEAVKLKQIFVKTRAEADAALEALSTGSDFEKVSALKSSDPTLRKNSGSLGYIPRGTLLPEIEKEVFALKAGQHSGVFKTGQGFSIFQVEEHRPAQPAVYEKIKEELRLELLNQALAQQLPLLTAELRQKAEIKIIR